MTNSFPTRYFLFGDVQHFSRIPDTDLPRFVDGFLRGVSTVLESPEFANSPPLFANTWGDGILLVYGKAETAGRVALAIRRWMVRNPFEVTGIPAPLSLRMGMHAGPVFETCDPITARPTFLGTHINRAARIEPIAEEGQIYVSCEFAALAALEESSAFRCVPQGLVDLPKGGGRIPVYRLEKRQQRPRLEFLSET